MGFRSGVNPGIVKSKEASFDKTDRKGCTNAIMYVCMLYGGHESPADAGQDRRSRKINLSE
jgi:hypothetical protein